MLKLCRTQMTLPPQPIGLHLLINTPGLSYLKEMLDNNHFDELFKDRKL